MRRASATTRITTLSAKLRPGVSARAAQAEMDAITARLRHDYPEVYPPNGGLTFGVVPLLEQVVGDARYSLFVLLGAVGFVLLIACANVANLQLSRAVSRQKEIAVRAALGAGRGRILRQLFTESVLLALGGGALGILLSFVCVHWVHVLGPKSVPRLASIGVDGEALLFTVALCVFSGILFGLAPAWRATQIDLHGTLKDAGRGSAGAGSVWGRGRNLRRMLVISEMALSVVLLIGAGLLIRSFSRLLQVSPGFNPENVLTVELSMSGPKYKDEPAILAIYHQLWERLEALPGVTAAGAVTSLPLSEMYAWGPIVIEGRTPPPGENFINADQRIAGGDYFQAMEIPLRSGRFFNAQRYGSETARSSHRRIHGPRILAARRSARQTHPLRRPGRRWQMDHHRRRSRPHQAVHAGHRFAHRTLFAPNAVSRALDECSYAQPRQIQLA